MGTERDQDKYEWECYWLLVRSANTVTCRVNFCSQSSAVTRFADCTTVSRGGVRSDWFRWRRTLHTIAHEFNPVQALID